MRCARRRSGHGARCRPGVADVDQQSKRPSGVSIWDWKQSCDDPKSDGDTETADSFSNERSRFRCPSNARILQSENTANAAVCGSESGGISAAERIRGVSRHYRHQEHLRDDEHAFQDIINPELRRKRRVTEPGEKD